MIFECFSLSEPGSSGLDSLRQDTGGIDFQTLVGGHTLSGLSRLSGLGTADSNDSTPIGTALRHPHCTQFQLLVACVAIVVEL